MTLDTSGHNNPNFRHGLRYTREYECWISMKKRCSGYNGRAYKDYLERGIRVYELWIDDPEAFIYYLWTSIGPHPGKGYSLDRIDNDGNYEPGNLRWATNYEQANNRRPRRSGYKKKNASSCYRGVSWAKRYNKWVAFGYCAKKSKNLGLYKDELEAAAAVEKYQQENNI